MSWLGMVTLFCPQIEAATTAWSSNPATFSISRHSGQDTTHPSTPFCPVNTTTSTPARENIRFTEQTEAMYFLLFFPILSLSWFLQNYIIRLILFLLFFRSEMLEFLSLCTDPTECSKPDGGYSKDFQYFNIQIFPITKYTSDSEI